MTKEEFEERAENFRQNALKKRIDVLYFGPVLINWIIENDKTFIPSKLCNKEL